MDRNSSDATDARDTGEHFLGALEEEPDGLVQISARRVADLTAQIEFLDREIARYRELVERERIRHSTELADLQLEADTKIDEFRREERRQIQELHDSYRGLMHQRQIEFDNALSANSAASAAELAETRRHHTDVLEREQARRDAVLEANRKQAVDEINESHQRTRQALHIELAQATAAVERLQVEVDAQIKRADQAEHEAAKATKQVAVLTRQIERIDSQHRLRLEEAEKRTATANSRLDAERQRSAATLSELLERSAAIAAEADKARSDFAAEHAKAEHAAATAHEQARAEYKELADAADLRAARAIEREIELEAAIGDLRSLMENRDT